MSADKLNLLDVQLKKHALRTMDSRVLDIRNEVALFWGNRVGVCVGIVCALLPFLVLILVKMFNPNIVDPSVRAFLMVSSCLMTWGGVLLVGILAFRLCVNLAAFVPVYLFYFFIAKSHVGGVAAYSISFSILIFVLQWFAITS
ncbi:hypothetical protein [Maridesulfovibrio sp.]|uniref:hypothetical protein n=1 Tax=Maridesulfovibrio sp. TaxID=2795000 RepID=UPI0029CAAA8D|nr:hypothetical protein [Maridesulfovibrio sp.]